MKRVGRTGASALLAATCALGACENATVKVVDTAESKVSGIEGTLLQRLQLEDEHQVEFYDMGAGHLAVRESMRAGSGPEVLASVSHLRTLSDVFRHVAPGQTVPSALISADLSSATLRRATASQSSNRPPKPAMVDLRPDLIKPTAQQARTADGVEKQTSALLNCSADRFGDNWGANWFLGFSCDPLATPFKECHTNWGWYDRNVYSDNGVSVRQFEGDFNESGTMKASFRDCSWNLLHGWECFYMEKLNLAVRPRRVEGWFFPSDEDIWRISGSSPCGHLGLVMGH